jgi:hypothetical protein
VPFIEYLSGIVTGEFIPIDTFSSDYDEFVDEFGTEFEAHGA